MALPFVFATDQSAQMAWLDSNFNAVAATGLIPCTASGTNSIVLTPLANTVTVSAYTISGLPLAFSFVASGTSTGAISAQVGALASLPVYLPGGVLQAGANAVLAAGNYVIAYNAALNSGGGGFAIISALSSLGTPPPGQCQLNFVSSTQIKLSPVGGQFIQIAGQIFAIPSGGITAANTSVFVNGVAGQNLALSTFYYVYLFNNAGVLTVDFSTTGHTGDTAAGNVGVEIESGNNSRSLIGMVFTTASATFVSSGPSLGVRSWFNRTTPAVWTGGGTGGATTTSASLIEL